MPYFPILLKMVDIAQLMASEVWGWFPWFKLTTLRKWAVSTSSIFSEAISAPEVPLLTTGNGGPTESSLPCFQQSGPGWRLRWWERSPVNMFEDAFVVGGGAVIVESLMQRLSQTRVVVTMKGRTTTTIRILQISWCMTGKNPKKSDKLRQKSAKIRKSLELLQWILEYFWIIQYVVGRRLTFIQGSSVSRLTLLFVSLSIHTEVA